MKIFCLRRRSCQKWPVAGEPTRAARPPPARLHHDQVDQDHHHGDHHPPPHPCRRVCSSQKSFQSLTTNKHLSLVTCHSSRTWERNLCRGFAVCLPWRIFSLGGTWSNCAPLRRPLQRRCCACGGGASGAQLLWQQVPLFPNSVTSSLNFQPWRWRWHSLLLGIWWQICVGAPSCVINCSVTHYILLQKDGFNFFVN